MAELRILPPAAKYFKKLKDKNLKSLYQKELHKDLDRLSEMAENLNEIIMDIQLRIW